MPANSFIRGAESAPLPVPLPMCTTGDHEAGDDDCRCVVAECGCKTNPEDIRICDVCNSCGDCCNCNYCQGCDEYHDSDSEFCLNCELCGDCCKCHRCTARRCTNVVKENDPRLTWCSNCERCGDCCSCSYCEACASTISVDDGMCGNCDYCYECCECSNCNDCGARRSSDSICGDCECCTGCCECDTTYLRHGDHELTFYTSARNQFRRNPLKRLIGVELEVDYFRNPKDAQVLQAAVDKWKDSVKDDGSLHLDGAFEINTQPTNGDLFLDHIAELCKGFEEMGARCTPACGMHTHVDARDLNYYQVGMFTRVYHRIEKPLFRVAHPNRTSNTYSVPCADKMLCVARERPLIRRELLGKLYNSGSVLQKGKKYTNIKSSKEDHHGGGTRYNALNLHSYFYRGTIEFRHKEGSTDYAEITNWALLVGYLIESANQMTEHRLRNLPDDPNECLLALLPQSLHPWVSMKWDAWGKTSLLVDRCGSPIHDGDSVAQANAYWGRAEQERIREEQRRAARVRLDAMRAEYERTPGLPPDAVNYDAQPDWRVGFTQAPLTNADDEYIDVMLNDQEYEEDEENL